MKRTADINEILKPLKDTQFQAYLSNAVQVADILDWILSQVGVAEIWQTSFSISEEFLRRLFFICKDKKVSRINLVLDHKATNKTLKLWAFITQVIERTYLADNHSKILLVRAVGKKGTETGDSDNSNSKSMISDSHTVQNRVRHHLTKPHARQSCRKCFHQHRPEYLCLALRSNRRFNH